MFSTSDTDKDTNVKKYCMRFKAHFFTARSFLDEQGQLNGHLDYPI